MIVVCTFADRPSVTLENLPEDARWVFLCTDAPSGEWAVIGSTDGLARWLAEPHRVAPTIEVREIVEGAAEAEIEMTVEKVPAE
jgi:hypothetical protein